MVMTNEYRVLGPPGAGKTTYIMRQLTRAATKYDPDQIYLTSFTKAAAFEIANRCTRGLVDSQNIGTVHAHCFRHLERPKLMASLSKEWAEAYPNWALKTVRTASYLDEPMMDPLESSGDKLLMDYHFARSQPRNLLNRLTKLGEISGPMLKGFSGASEDLRAFAMAWEDFKKQHDALDFTDLLLRAPDSLPNCKVLLCDEAQDCTPLMWQVVRRWGEQAETFVVVGDEDQMLYSWLGADPKELMTPLPAGHVKVLHQSYRVPQAVHALSQRWIQKLGDRRNPKAYTPTSAPGQVVYSPRSMAEPEALVATIRQEVGSVMVLAPCGYMLTGILEALRAAAVPFHNPYRRRRGDWNPLGRRVTLRKVRSFLDAKQAMDDNDIKALRKSSTWDWVQLIRSKGNFKPGFKAELNGMEDGWDYLHALAWGLEPPAMDAFRKGDMTWFGENIQPSLRVRVGYISRMIQRGETAPRVIPGTIHSVKGGEADVVYLIPDLSRAAVQACYEQGQDAEDAIRRMFYVGMTRARRKLILCEPATKCFVEIR